MTTADNRGKSTSVIYGCTTDTCSERFRGFTDEPTFCSICLEDLTEIDNPDGQSLDALNALAATAPRPLSEVTE